MKLREAIGYGHYQVYCANNAAAHYGEKFTAWDRLVYFCKGFMFKWKAK
jgi:hypothetical protein